MSEAIRLIAAAQLSDESAKSLTVRLLDDTDFIGKYYAYDMAGLVIEMKNIGKKFIPWSAMKYVDINV